MKKAILLATIALSPAAAHADTVRAAVGKPLQQAEVLIQRHDYQAALVQVSKARAVGHLTSYETVVVAQIDGIAASGAGDYAQAAAAYETVLNSGTVPPAAKIQYSQAIAGFYDQAQDYPHTILWVNKYIAAGGNDPRTRVLLAQAYYTQGDFAHAEQAAERDQAAATAAGQALPEAELQLLASSADKSGDQPGYRAALQALLKAYPSPQYWSAAIANVTALPNFPDRLTLDTDRLRFATGTLTDPGDLEDFAERAILAGNPAAAHQVLETAFASGLLNNQTDAGHAARLRALAAKQSATAPVSAASAVDEAQASAKAGDPDGALNLGIAYDSQGNRTAAAQTFETIAAAPSASPSDPDVALAQLWLIYVNSNAATNATKTGA
jgi:hypothetical protein